MGGEQDAGGLPPAVAAARRDRRLARPVSPGATRAYPVPSSSPDPDAVAAQLEATRALLHARTPAQVAAVVRTFVHDLGGAVVPARLGETASTLPVDVSLGLSEPLLVRVDELSVGAMRLASQVNLLLEDARQALAALSRPAPPAVHRTPVAAALPAYLERLRDADADGACAIATGLLHQGHGVEQIVRELLGPAQAQVGRHWQEGRWSVADEHAASAVTERALSALTWSQAALRGPVAPVGRHVVVACAEGEWHSLPARLAAAALSASGLRVTVLGGSMPAEHLAQRLAVGDVDVLALSCTLATNLLGALRCVQAAHAVGVPVVAGGRAFGTTPARALAIGADGWSADPTDLTREPPVLPHPRPVIDVPYDVLLLDAPDPDLVARVATRLDPVGPGLSAADRGARVEALTSLLRHAAAAVLVDDVSLLAEVVGWYRELDGPALPADLVTTAVLDLAAAVEPSAPTGARVLRSAAGGPGRAGGPAAPATGPPESVPPTES